MPNIIQLPRELTVADKFCPALAPSTYERSPIALIDDDTLADVLPLAKRIRVVCAAIPTLNIFSANKNTIIRPTDVCILFLRVEQVVGWPRPAKKALACDEQII